jgi:hypothetical protein
MRRTLSAGALVLALAAAGCTTSREQIPTAQERARIDNALRSAGYTRWEGIVMREGA